MWIFMMPVANPAPLLVWPSRITVYKVLVAPQTSEVTHGLHQCTLGRHSKMAGLGNRMNVQHVCDENRNRDRAPTGCIHGPTAREHLPRLATYEHWHKSMSRLPARRTGRLSFVQRVLRRTVPVPRPKASRQ
jgi:hypothetical protein